MTKFKYVNWAQRVLPVAPFFFLLIANAFGAADKILTPIKTFETGSEISSIRWNSQGDVLATSGGEPNIRLWSNEGTLIDKIDTHTARVMGLAWKPDGYLLASTNCDLRDATQMHCVGGSAHLWNLRTKTEERELLHPHPHDHDQTSSRMAQKEGLASAIDPHSRPGGELRAISWSRDGRFIAISDASGILTVLNAASGDIVLREKTQWVISALDWSADGLLASASLDNTIVVRDIQRMKMIGTLRGQDANILSLAWHPRLPLLASGAGNKTVVIWDVAADKIVKTLNSFDAAVRALAWHPEGNYLAASSYTMGAGGGAVLIFDTKTWQQIGQGAVHRGAHISVLAWDANGDRIATGGDDRIVGLWRFTP